MNEVISLIIDRHANTRDDEVVKIRALIYARSGCNDKSGVDNGLSIKRYFFRLKEFSKCKVF